MQNCVTQLGKECFMKTCLLIAAMAVAVMVVSTSMNAGEKEEKKDQLAGISNQEARSLSRFSSFATFSGAGGYATNVRPLLQASGSVMAGRSALSPAALLELAP